MTPAEVQVYPEQEATAVVVFSPPAGNTTRSGSFPFAVRAESVVDPDVSAVAEGDLEIGRVFGLQTKITPVTSLGSVARQALSGDHQLGQRTGSAEAHRHRSR